MIRARAHGLSRGIAISLGLVQLLGCSADPGGGTGTGTGTGPWAIARRLIEDPPGRLIVPADLVGASERQRWNLSAPDEGTQWRPDGVDLHYGREGIALVMASSKRYFTIRRTVDFDAASVDAIRLDLSEDVLGGQFWLRWIGPDQSYGPERTLHVPAMDVERPGPVRFDVADHAAWSGRIVGLELAFGVPLGRSVELESVTALALEQTRAGLLDWTREPLLVDLGGEVRSAVLVHASEPRAFEVDVPEHARLEFGYAAANRDAQGRALTLRAIVGGRPGAPLFSTTLRSAEDPLWETARVALPSLAGKRVRFELAVEDASPSPGAGASAFWAHPELLVPATEPRPNVVLIVVDTLRADRLSAYGNPRPTSPHIDAWAARRATLFEHVVASAPWTLPAHVSLMSGLDAYRHGVNHRAPVPLGVPLMAERLRRAGYSTFALTGGAFLHPRFGLARGFDRFTYWSYAGPTQGAHELERHLARARDLVASYRDRPFFLFFHTYEVHAPYLPREPWFERFGGASDAPELLADHHVAPGPESGFRKRHHLGVRGRESGSSWRPLPPELSELPYALYDSAIAYTDDELATLLADLEALDATRPTLVMFTADHGEMLGEHGLADHTPLYDETLMIPLIISPPGGAPAGTRVSQQVRQVDVLPTVLQLAGLPGADGIDGVSLASAMGPEPSPLAGERAALSYVSVSNLGASIRVGNRIKLIFDNTAWAPADGRVELFDLVSDPDEQQNLVSTQADDAEQLSGRVAEEIGPVVPGLRVRVRNPGTAEIGGWLRGTAVDPVKVKSFDLPCSCVEWGGVGAARFRVPPGAEYTLLIEDLGRASLSLAIDGDASGAWAVLPGMDVTTPVTLVAEDGEHWRRASGEAPKELATIELWRVGDPSSPRDEATPPDLEDQLRALGYLQ